MNIYFDLDVVFMTIGLLMMCPFFHGLYEFFVIAFAGSLEDDEKWLKEALDKIEKRNTDS